jgi:hypothetical protein
VDSISFDLYKSSACGTILDFPSFAVNAAIAIFARIENEYDAIAYPSTV